MGGSLYQRLGGLDGVSRIVLDMYERVLESSRLEPFFANVDMRRLVEHQASFLASVVGGPASYSDAELKSIHAHLDIDSRAFREMLEQLRAALIEHHVSGDDIAAVLAEFHAREPVIVSNHSRGPSSRVA